MARGKLFEAWTFKLSLPAPFDDPKFSGMHDFGLSQYNTAGRLRKATLHAPSLRALFAYAKHNGIFGINVYHVPITPILAMILLVGLLQIVLSLVLSSNLKKETLVERIRYQG